MSCEQQRQLCLYRYDPLDRLIHQSQAGTPELQRFYCKSRLATEIQGALGFSIVQHGDQLLGQQQREGDASDTTLLVTDQQRSISHTLKASHQRKPFSYAPYGHRPAASGLLSLLGFNGERPDRVTGHYLLGNGYRAFNPVLLRFNSPDSWSPFGKGGLNSYAYCLGDPINRHDPNGHAPVYIVPPRIEAGLRRWRARLHTNATNRREAVAGLVDTGTIRFGDGLYSLRSGKTALQGVKAKENYDYLNGLASREANRDGKFSDDWARASRESELFAKVTKQPADEYPRIKLFKYIARRPSESPSNGTYSVSRLRKAAQGDFDPQVPRYSLPSVEESERYLQEMLGSGVGRHLQVAARQIRDTYFIKIDRPIRR